MLTLIFSYLGSCADFIFGLLFSLIDPLMAGAGISLSGVTIPPFIPAAMEVALTVVSPIIDDVTLMSTIKYLIALEIVLWGIKFFKWLIEIIINLFFII